jgi:hypothetical protein
VLKEEGATAAAGLLADNNNELIIYTIANVRIARIVAENAGLLFARSTAAGESMRYHQGLVTESIWSLRDMNAVQPGINDYLSTQIIVGEVLANVGVLLGIFSVIVVIILPTLIQSNTTTSTQ